MVGMLHEAMRIPNVHGNSDNEPRSPCKNIGRNADRATRRFFELLQDAESELYPGCVKFTKLSFTVRLLLLKVTNGWTDTSIDMLLELLKEVFPEAKIPTSYYEAQKINDDLGFTCETIDACRNNCMLFRGDDEGLTNCEIYGASRYKEEGKKLAAKQMRYFPLKPRLQKLFMSSKTTSQMKWHKEERVDDGVFRHPADSLAWKQFDVQWPDFASDCRNVRLAPASDGFNPFRTISIAHSTWPVVLIIYNLPPWICMTPSSFILSILIDGPRGPGTKIDVYLQPLIDDLKELWSTGLPTYDVSADQVFRLRAALLWTINDFPAYAMLSGWSTKNEKACPCCANTTKSTWLKHGRKFSYACHRRFLLTGHRLRRDKVSFNGKVELSAKPLTLSGSDILRQLDSYGILIEYKKEDLKKWRRDEYERQSSRGAKEHNWKKKSIFFELEYWEHNACRHNIDVLHTERNNFDNLLFTCMGTPGKTKDNLNARRDLKEMGVRDPLHPQESNGSSKVILPPGPFTMSKKDKEIFCQVLKNLKVPDVYASNISRHVNLNDRSIWGLKSHDCHILMQQLLPIAVRRVLPNNVVQVIIELSNFFRQLCSKVNSKNQLEYIQDRIALTLCNLERIFPPSFFDIMEHLPIHLAEEALTAGAVQFRWMYPIERYLLTLKKYVRNRAHPEGSISKGYLLEECLNFCSRYLNDVETKSNRPPRNFDGNNEMGRLIGKGKQVHMDDCTWVQAHRYVLVNTDGMTPYREMHMSLLAGQYPRAGRNHIQRIHNETFHVWLKNHIFDLQSNANVEMPEIVRNLAVGPDKWARRFNVCIVNGFRFRTKSYEVSMATQNSGVMLRASTVSFASARDRNPREGQVIYYGILIDIIKIRYTNDLQYTLFKYDWIDNEKGKMEDEFKFTLVNFTHLMYGDNGISDEPFILSSQAEQCWYVADPIDSSWNVVMRMSIRDNFDVYSRFHDTYGFSPQPNDDRPIAREQDANWVRQGVEAMKVDPID